MYSSVILLPNLYLNLGCRSQKGQFELTSKRIGPNGLSMRDQSPRKLLTAMKRYRP